MSIIRNLICGGMITALLALAPYDSRSATLPDTVVLGSLEKLYDKSPFNHARHITLIKDCGTCHHHTTGTLVHDANCVRCHRNSSETKVVACRGCHLAEPFDAQALLEKEGDQKRYHQDKPGLKGAYHLSCRGCHVKMGGPVGCGSCHTRKNQGEAFYNSGAYAPKKTAKSGGHH